MSREFQTFGHHCGNCVNFDGFSENFGSSNRCKCRHDGRLHWSGDRACENHSRFPESYVMAEARKPHGRVPRGRRG